MLSLILEKNVEKLYKVYLLIYDNLKMATWKRVVFPVCHDFREENRPDPAP
jgi:hypothetical protein